MSKILIIEDDDAIVRVLCRRLQAAGYETLVANDCVQGVHLAHHQRPDLVILDLQLPAGGGLTALKNFHLSVNTKYVPVLVLTAMQDEEYKRQVLAEGVAALMSKPYDGQELLDQISQLLTPSPE